MQYKQTGLRALSRVMLLVALFAFGATLFAPAAQALDPDSYHFGILPQVEKPDRGTPWINPAASDEGSVRSSESLLVADSHTWLISRISSWLSLIFQDDNDAVVIPSGSEGVESQYDSQTTR